MKVSEALDAINITERILNVIKNQAAINRQKQQDEPMQDTDFREGFQEGWQACIEASDVDIDDLPTQTILEIFEKE